jgi:hypothetical protein
VFSDAEEWDVLEDIPNDSAAALILIEHHWFGAPPTGYLSYQLANQNGGSSRWR